MQCTKLNKYSVWYLNQKEYHSIKREIWSNNCYLFNTKSPKPVIIDIGSHIGLSILYFKKIYPNSSIIAFEPNPYLFDILKQNVEENNLLDIELHSIAISNSKGSKPLYITNSNDWYSNSSLIKGGWTGKEIGNCITVTTNTLDEYLKGRSVDLLKIDSEGLELEILKSIKEYFDNIQNIIIEYHPIKDKPINRYIEILSPKYDISLFRDGKEIKTIDNSKLCIIRAIYRKRV